MIGEKVTIRVRMSMHDAHYAGNLVNGSRMLDYFGDVATELIIRMDGDEGLPESAARVLEEPVLVGRAEMIGVTPVECQRGSQDEAFGR